ncbi:MAG: nucleotidyltransferase domain-containing protein [Acidimicrobiales bacterium]
MPPHRDLAREVPDALSTHPNVTAVELIGSRARGEATELSDWDFHVDTSDFDAVATDLTGRVAALDPIAGLWDPLSEHHVYAFILPGPVKVDLLFDEPHELAPPWSPSAATLPDIDVHFWDWTLWLAGKVYAGKHELVAAELEKMWRHLLAPIGVTSAPASLHEAVDRYVTVRRKLEELYGTPVRRRLADEVMPVVERVSAAP